MTWVKLDDGFTDHPKVVGLSDRAFRTHVRALCYCGRFSPGVGHIPVSAFRQLGATPAVVTELITAELWEERDALFIHDFAVYHPKPDRVAKAEAGRLGGLASGKARRSKVEAETKQDASDLVEPKRTPVPDPTRPVPIASCEAKSAPAAPQPQSKTHGRPRNLKVPIQPMTEDELSRLKTEYPDFDVGAELENCRNLPTWEFGYVAEYGALRNRLRLKRADRASKGGANGRTPTRGNREAEHADQLAYFHAVAVSD